MILEHIGIADLDLGAVSDVDLDDEYFEKFVKCLNKDECFRWMFKIFNGNKKGSVNRYRRKDNIYMIWEYLFNSKVVSDNKYYYELLEYKLKEFLS